MSNTNFSDITLIYALPIKSVELADPGYSNTFTREFKKNSGFKIIYNIYGIFTRLQQIIHHSDLMYLC